MSASVATRKVNDIFVFNKILRIFAPVMTIGAGQVPILFFKQAQMTVSQIISAIGPKVGELGLFLVDVDVTEEGDVTLTIERDSGSVDMDDCTAVNDAFLGLFDRDAEDYSLTVTSAGLDQPFKVPRQFSKAVGSMVEVALKGGRKIVGKLEAADGQGVTVTYSVKEAVPGKKRKEMVERTERFEMGEVNAVRPHIEF